MQIKDFRQSHEIGIKEIKILKNEEYQTSRANTYNKPYLLCVAAGLFNPDSSKIINKDSTQ
jgi:hypothetical protein